jgi:hypothetical protein
MSALALKFGALLTTLLVFVGSFGYTTTHAKNPSAPLQPPVADAASQTAPPAASPTPLPSLVGTRRGNPPRPTSSPAPLRNLLPAVQATTLPAITFTHVS